MAGLVPVDTQPEFDHSLVPVDHNPFDIGPPLIGDGGQFSAGMPWANRAADIGSKVAYGMMGNLATLPKRAIDASAADMEHYRQNGFDQDYTPQTIGPAAEAAMLPMGAGALAGVPVRGAESVLGSGFVRRPTMKQPSELYHVVGPDYAAGEPLRSLYARKGDAAYDEYAARWLEAGDLVQYHPHQNFFYETLADAQNHASDFGGRILKVDPSKVEGLNFDKNEGFWTTREDVSPDAISHQFRPVDHDPEF